MAVSRSPILVGAARSMRYEFLISALVTSLAELLNAGSGVQRAAAAKGTGPPVPYEDRGACPFEGCVYQEWIANARVDVRSGRRPNDPLAFSLRPGDRVRAVTGIVVTVKPGRVQFKAAVDLHSDAGSVHVQPGETLYLLTYHGEGETTAWFKGRLYERLDGAEFFDARCENRSSSCNGSILERPHRVWWVQLRNLRGVIGWTRETEKFENKAAIDSLHHVATASMARRASVLGISER